MAEMTKPERGEQPEQAEEAHAERADLPPAGEQGGLIGQGGELTQGPVGNEAHEVDQAVEGDKQGEEDGEDTDHFSYSQERRPAWRARTGRPGDGGGRRG